MKFRFYIVNLFDGWVIGTDDPDKAKQFVREDFEVISIDAERGVAYLSGDLQETLVEPAK
jgi:hypothetical protein